MEILVCGMTENRGGIEVYLANLVRGLFKSTIKLSFVKEKKEIAFDEVLKEYNCKVYDICWRRKNPIKHIRELNKLLKEHPEIDLLYINAMSSAAIPSALAGKLAGKKVLVHSRNNQTKNMLIHNLLKPALNICIDYRFACSDLAAKYMFGKRKCEVISNGIDFERFKYSESIRKQIRDTYYKNENPFVIGFVGNLTYQKNVLFLIDVFATVVSNNKDARLMIIGDGELKKDMESAIQAYGKEVEKRVLMLGKQEDTSKFYQAFDLFILPSRFEGFGNVLIEAQIAGLPCVCSKDVIPVSTKISENISYISLEASLNEWRNEIEKYTKRDREEYKSTGLEKKYELSKAIAHIEELLLAIDQKSS